MSEAELKVNMRVVVDQITKRYGEDFSKDDLKAMWEAAIAKLPEASQWFRSEAERLVPERGVNRRIREELACKSTTQP